MFSNVRSVLKCLVEKSNALMLEMVPDKVGKDPALGDGRAKIHWAELHPSSIRKKHKRVGNCCSSGLCAPSVAPPTAL